MWLVAACTICIIAPNNFVPEVLVHTSFGLTVKLQETYDFDFNYSRGATIIDSNPQTFSSMFSQRAMSRAATQRFAAQVRPQSIRTPFQRRFASTESGFTGAEDNAFNRERQAVKEHAAATSGELWF